MAEIVQVVNGEGQFETEDVQRFVELTDLAASRTNYNVVAIMGPQSSGKSTLLNHVFGTSFAMMDAMAGRGQTTKGIWMSKAPKVTDTSILVMDLEGSDGRERGEDDTNFERQSALFALAVADVLLVNIWCHDIGREQGSGKPLLKTIFQVNLKLFAPEPDRKRSVLLFVLRDKTKTPLPKLIEVLEADLDRMWDSIAKPAAYQGSKLTDFFEVQYAALSHYDERYEDFQADAVTLRRRFSPDGDETLIRGYDKLPGDAFALSVHNIWDVIRSQKDLNLPAHKVMVANIRCQEIMEDQLRAFASDQAWLGLQEQSAGGIVEGFGPAAHGLMDSCIKGYEAEAMYFDPRVREGKHEELNKRLTAAVQPVYGAQVAAHHAAVLHGAEKELRLALSEGSLGGFAAAAAACRADAVRAFDTAFAKHLHVEGTEWTGEAERKELAAALDAHIARVRSERVAAAVAKAEKQLASLVSGPVIALLEVCRPGLWPRLYAVCREAAGAADRALLQALEGYELGGEEALGLSRHLGSKATALMENHVREASLTRLSRMKDRFQEVFALDDNRAPRMWSARDDVPAIAHTARLAAASVLSQLAVMRPPASKSHELGGDAVDAAVMQLARASPASPSGEGGDAEFDDAGEASTSQDGDGGPEGAHGSAIDVLSAAAWPGVDEAATLLHPHDIRTTWREFMSYSNVLVQQALSAQQANRLAQNKSPPLWALVGMLVLGWNELWWLLTSPLYLLLGLVSFLFLRSLWTEMDVERELQRGALPGALSLSSKFMPACRAVVRKTQSAVQDIIKEAQKLQHGDGGEAGSEADAQRPSQAGLRQRSNGAAGARPAGGEAASSAEHKKDR